MHNIIDLEVVRYQLSKKHAENSLAEFAQQAWHILEPSTELKWGWSLEAICDHLEAVTDGDILRLLLNVPPGSMKSLLTSVLWPAWEWGPRNMPGMRYISTSHKQDLAVRDNMKCRRLIQSEWYQDRWPVILTGDQNAKTKFENEQTGFREAMAFTSMTGARGDRIILDDPLSVDDGRSDAALNAAEITFRESLPTRVNNEKSAIIVIMQRLHEKDTSGIILAGDFGYEHLCLPMRYERLIARASGIGFKDPRTKEGELLFPERFPEKTVVELEKMLGEYGSAGQLQQRPSPATGGILKTDHFNSWPTDRELPVFDYIIQSYDTAFTERTTGDPSACTVWGAFTYVVKGSGSVKDKQKRGVMLLDAWSEHLGYPDLRAKVIEEWASVYGKVKDNGQRKGRKADAVLVEAKASGQSLLQDLRQANIPCIPYNPGNADKINRAHQVAPILELECIWIPESNKNPGTFVTWAREFVEQCTKFPNATHDDFVDTFTSSMILMRDQGRFELQFAEPDEVEEEDYIAKKKRKENPYAS